MAKPKPNLPKYVKLTNGRYVYRPYIPVSKRGKIDVDKFGYIKPPIRLGSASTPIHKIYAAYAAAEEQFTVEQEPDHLTLNWLLQEYKTSRTYKKLGTETKKRYGKCEKILEHTIEIDGIDTPLGQLPAELLTTALIRRILDKRLEQYQADNKKGESQCNNEKSLIASMYTHGIQYLDQLTHLKNPCHGISKYEVEVRERYVTDEEYSIQYQVAKESNIPYLPIVMELSYLLATRGIESTDLKISNATKTGIIVARRKGSKTTIVRWTPRLKVAWETAISLHEDPQPEFYLLKSARGGGRLRRSALSTTWQRKLKEEMDKRGLSEIYFQLHDLKRKGISDADDDRIAGHVSDSTRANYNVKHQEYDAPA